MSFQAWTSSCQKRNDKECLIAHFHILELNALILSRGARIEKKKIAKLNFKLKLSYDDS